MAGELRHRRVIAATVGLSCLIVASGAAAQQPKAGFVPPPRTIADIAAILNEQRPDPARLAKLRAEADVLPPSTASGQALADFHFKRAEARSDLGRFKEAVADLDKAVSIGRGQGLDIDHYLRRQSIEYRFAGDYKRSLQLLQERVRAFQDAQTGKGRLIAINRQMATTYLVLGNLRQAEAAIQRARALWIESQSWPAHMAIYRPAFQADVEGGTAELMEARGKYTEAEAGYRRAQVSVRATLAGLSRWPIPNPPSRSLFELRLDNELAAEGRMKARQGRFAEGEADVRQALLNRLKLAGKYTTGTARVVMVLAALLREQGRFAEAERLVRTSIEIYRAIGVADDLQRIAVSISALASILNLQGRWPEAADAYNQLEQVTKGWEPARKEALDLDGGLILTFYNTNNLLAGINAAERFLARQQALYGAEHPETAAARGLLAVGLVRVGRDADAAREFSQCLPILMSTFRDADDETGTAARERRLQIVIEAYLTLLARRASSDDANESFRFADAIRGQSVQKALTASSARTLARDPAQAELVRKEQDLEKQIAAQLGLINSVLALPSEQRDDKGLQELRTEVTGLHAQRDAARKEIARRLPTYAELIDPKLPTANDIRAVLKAHEAFLSFYFGQQASFAWAVSKDGPTAFVAIPLTASDLERKVTALREALEPKGDTAEEIPAFDLALAHELYTLLLQPIEASWRSAKSMIVVTNGALSMLPLGVLPTALPASGAESKLMFDAYRQVSWIARSYAVSQLPSAAALRTLRQLPPASAKREKLIGFGDPFFNADQAAAAQKSPFSIEVAATSRGLALKRRALAPTRGVDSASLALLPRLPDTADELRSVALALQADPIKALNLGKDANEKKVKTTDLSRFRVVAFATHGLVPGELDGLTQPALALTAPNVADVDGDGLLTLEEILALKLDADWVVLSACNTGAGLETGAEAASGLGRAFFYAGSRALLVTNWSVQSDSARELVTELFRRQAAEPGLTRAEALRQAAMAVMDGPGYVRAGQSLFSYAHPFFWAPYSIIGDGGARD